MVGEIGAPLGFKESPATSGFLLGSVSGPELQPILRTFQCVRSRGWLTPATTDSCCAGTRFRNFRSYGTWLGSAS